MFKPKASAKLIDSQVMTWAQVASILERPAPARPTPATEVRISSRMLAALGTEGIVSILVCTKQDGRYRLQCDPAVWNSITSKISRARSEGNNLWASQLAHGLRFRVDLAADEHAANSHVASLKQGQVDAKKKKADQAKERMAGVVELRKRKGRGRLAS